MPNSAQLRCKVSTWFRDSRSLIDVRSGSVGTLWSAVANVRSGRRTLRPAMRRPSNAWALVTSWTRWQSMYSRASPVGSVATVWASKIFSYSVVPMVNLGPAGACSDIIQWRRQALWRLATLRRSVRRIWHRSRLMRTVRLVTLGCKVNQYETQHVKEALESAGYREASPGEPAGLCVVNTCTVTAEGDAKSRQAVRRLAADNPGAAVVVMGCYATRAPDEVARLP